MRTILCTIAIAFALTTSVQTSADETGPRTTYTFFHELINITRMDTNKILTISSSIEGVSHEDIVITIRSKTLGDMPVYLDASGQLIDFPIMEELFSENPFVTHNQPRGSLETQLQFALPQDDDLTDLLKNMIAHGLRPDKEMIKYSALAILSGQTLSWAAHAENCTHDHGREQQPVLELRYFATGTDHLHLRTRDRNDRLRPENGIFTILPPEGDCSFDPWIRFCPNLKPSWEVKNKNGYWVSIVSLIEAFEATLEPTHPSSKESMLR